MTLTDLANAACAVSRLEDSSPAGPMGVASSDMRTTAAPAADISPTPPEPLSTAEPADIPAVSVPIATPLSSASPIASETPELSAQALMIKRRIESSRRRRQLQRQALSKKKLSQLRRSARIAKAKEVSDGRKALKTKTSAREAGTSSKMMKEEEKTVDETSKSQTLSLIDALTNSAMRSASEHGMYVMMAYPMSSAAATNKT